MSRGQNLQAFTGNGDVSKWVKNSRVGRKTPKKTPPNKLLNLSSSSEPLDQFQTVCWLTECDFVYFLKRWAKWRLHTLTILKNLLRRNYLASFNHTNKNAFLGGGGYEFYISEMKDHNISTISQVWPNSSTITPVPGVMKFTILVYSFLEAISLPSLIS